MYCTVDGLRLFYVEEGEGDPLLVLHGFPVDHRALYYTVETAMKKTTKQYRRVYVDLPGMGKSDTPNDLINADKMLEIVMQFAKQVFNSQPFSIVAYSYGGYLSFGILKKEPELVKKLVLISPAILSNASERQLPVKQVYSVEEFEDKNEVIYNAYKKSAVNITEVAYKRYVKEIYAGLIAGDRQFLRFYEHGGGYGFTFEKELYAEPFLTPTLMLVGWEDDVSGYLDLVAIKGQFLMSELVMIEHAGHNVQLDAFDEVVSRISEFFSNTDD